MSVNKVILVGNVGKDPEVKYLDGGVGVAKFSLATTERYKNKNGEQVSTTEWHNIVVWRGLSKVVEDYVKKGTLLYIEGKITNRSWDDKDGNKRYITEIVADNLQLLSKKSDNQESSGSTPASNQNEFDSTANTVADGPDDLPF
ncbi:MAG: single-stranded DNA-binding protein [Bacteroidota bacterium]